MLVGKHRVVTIDYTLTGDSGHIIDTSDGREPLSYLHGLGAIVPGLENALEGKSVGDKIDVSLSPDEGYGERHEGLCQEVPLSEFADVDDLSLGMQFRVTTDDGPMVITVVKITDDTVTVDGNHPLAGAQLNFDVTIREVRDATEEEISHGHAHSEDGQDTC